MKAKKLGYEHANVFSKATFSFVDPLIRRGKEKKIQDDTAREFLPSTDSAEALGKKFEDRYAIFSARDGLLHPSKVLWKTVFQLYKGDAILHLLWCLLESSVRVAQPVVLRQLLNWFVESEENSTESKIGWLWAGLMSVLAYLYVLIHHQTFYTGMRMGMRMRIQMIQAVQAKVLRLNGSSLANVTTGKIVNLVSNDVRILDEAGTFYVFLIGGPIELLAVFILVGLQMGFLASLAGVSALLLLIPVQALLAKYIGYLRAATAATTDERVKLTGEAITGALAFKMLAWEDPLYHKILEIREKEKYFIRRMNIIRVLNMALTFAITPLVTLIFFATARAAGSEITVANVFYSIGLLALPKLFMCEFFVHGVESVSEARVSFRRIGEFLSVDEPPSIDEFAVGQKDGDAMVKVELGTFSWKSESIATSTKLEDPPDATLSDFSLHVRSGEIVAVVGPVGSGKSSLLALLLGELETVNSGETKVTLYTRSMSYCPQLAWIVSGTIRENILFGRDFDKARYIATIKACCLDEDLKAMPAGDETEIGERGISLSGGQKARLALARAAYSEAQLHLLDDPLSAVDAKVGRTMFHTCIGNKGMMKNSTRILVTHQKQYLPYVDWILVLNHGKVVAKGTYEELTNMGIAEVTQAPADASVDQELEALELSNKFPGDSVEIPDYLKSMQSSSTSISSLDGTESADHGTLSKNKSEYWRRLASRILLRREAQEERPFRQLRKNVTITKSGRLTTKEDRETGSVSWRVYAKLIKEFGGPSAILVLIGLFGGQALYIYGDYWLSKWASATDSEQGKGYWIWVYAIFTGSIVVLSVARAQLFFFSFLDASSSIHENALLRLLHAPLSFYHTNPSGRMLNRFSRDMGALDEQLPKVTFDALQALMMVMGALVLLIVVIPYIIPLFVPLIGTFIFVQRRYLATSREVKRHEAVTRSPLYAQFSAILKGLPTIRSYGAGAMFRTSFLNILTNNCAWWYSWLTCARWVGFRLDFIVAILLTGAPLIMMAVHNSLGAELVGLSLTQSLYLAGLLQWMVRQTAEVENNMTSTERILSYCQLEQEPPTVSNGGALPPDKWPSTGRIQYCGVDAQYRPGLPLVLKNVSFRIEGGSSCGVVGRTGSGKSSLMLSLFRLIPVVDGTIIIDAVDVSKIGLDALRKQIAIIPQDPVLFSGTLRSNLDPWGDYSDASIWAALEKAQLKEKVTVMSADLGLSMKLQECGDNFSAGQKQLLCLARVLLQDARILALDEATANVDSKTDFQIQKAVHSAWTCGSGVDGKRTLLVIAHRLDTILDCQKVLVLASGTLIEEGNPRELLETPGSQFSMMARQKKPNPKK